MRLLPLNVRESHICLFSIIIAENAHLALCSRQSGLGVEDRLVPGRRLRILARKLQLLSLFLQFLPHNLIRLLCFLLKLPVLTLEMLYLLILFFVHLRQELHVLVCLPEFLL